MISPDLAKLPLAPLLLWQGRRVRQTALRLPEAAGPREGQAGQGPVRLRVLIVGDSSAAGVGAATQDQALAGQLAQHLALDLQRRHGEGAVCWQLLARSGDRSKDALKRLAAAEPLRPADVMVTALGVNDVLAQRKPHDWLVDLTALHALARDRAGVRRTVHCAVPPMHQFPLLPQPLRWWLGAQARRLNQALEISLQGQADRLCLPTPALPGRPSDWMASGHVAPDGFHPGPAGYALWAQALVAPLTAAAATD